MTGEKIGLDIENGRIYSVNENSELLAKRLLFCKKKRSEYDRTYVNPSIKGQVLLEK
jgi:hypothetical protein